MVVRFYVGQDRQAHYLLSLITAALPPDGIGRGVEHPKSSAFFGSECLKVSKSNYNHGIITKLGTFRDLLTFFRVTWRFSLFSSHPRPSFSGNLELYRLNARPSACFRHRDFLRFSAISALSSFCSFSATSSFLPFRFRSKPMLFYERKQLGIKVC